MSLSQKIISALLLEKGNTGKDPEEVVLKFEPEDLFHALRELDREHPDQSWLTDLMQKFPGIKSVTITQDENIDKGFFRINEVIQTIS